MRRYSSFFVQAWVDEGIGKARVCRLKVEHVQTGAVVVLSDMQELDRWMNQTIGAGHDASLVVAERPE
jgi:hypothetical protein